jgi:hypothetical protein
MSAKRFNAKARRRREEVVERKFPSSASLRLCIFALDANDVQLRRHGDPAGVAKMNHQPVLERILGRRRVIGCKWLSFKAL